MARYLVETIREGRVTDEAEVDELPKGTTLAEWLPLIDGGEQATGRAPAYLGGRRVGWTTVRVTR